MASALYYPHSTLQNKELIKSGLLLWDQVDCIAPPFGKRPYRFQEPSWNEASELLVRDHVPTAEEREAVHTSVRALIATGVPDWLRLSRRHPSFEDRTYPIYADKLLDATWSLLHDEGLSRWRADGDGVTSQPFGLFLMSLLADACAGKLKTRITDRVEAYAALGQALTASAGGTYARTPDVLPEGDSYQRLVSMSVRCVGTDDIPIRRLLALRRRELKETGAHYAIMRQKYHDLVCKYVARLATDGRTKADRTEIGREFRNEVKRDLAPLKDELRLANWNALFSKEVLVSAVAAAGVAFAPSAWAQTAGGATVVGVGSLTGTALRWRAARKKALESHATSWLYLARRRLT